MTSQGSKPYINIFTHPQIVRTFHITYPGYPMKPRWSFSWPEMIRLGNIKSFIEQWEGVHSANQLLFHVDCSAIPPKALYGLREFHHNFSNEFRGSVVGKVIILKGGIMLPEAGHLMFFGKIRIKITSQDKIRERQFNTVTISPQGEIEFC